MSDERDAILAELRLIQSSFAAEFERHDKAIAAFTEQQREVLARDGRTRRPQGFGEDDEYEHPPPSPTPS